MKKTMNKVAAVMAAVTMLGIGYVAGKANTPTEIKPAIIVAHAAIEETEVEEQVEPEIEEQVEEKKETLKDIVEVRNNDYGRTLSGYVILTEEGHYIEASYMKDAVSMINELCGRHLEYDESFGRWQITDRDTGRAVPIRRVIKN